MIWRITLFTVLVSYLQPVFAEVPNLSLDSNGTKGLTLTLNLPKTDLEIIQDTACDSLQISGWMKTLETGYPELPTTGTLLQVPATGRVTVQIIDQQTISLPNFTPCSVLKPTISAQDQVITAPAQSVHLTQPYPKAVVQVSERLLWRDVSVIRLTVTPFQWSPTTQTLRYFNKLRISVQFEHPLPEQKKVRNQQVAHDDYAQLLRDTIINYVPVASTNLRKRREPVTQETGRKTHIGTALRLAIEQTGIYRLTFEELVQAGLPSKFIRPQHLSLTNQGQEVAIKVITAEETLFTQGDAIEFYAQAIDTEFTGTNIYWLQWQKKGQGKRIKQRGGQIIEGGEPLETFYEQRHLETNRTVWDQVPEAPKVDYWFWQELRSPDENHSGTYDYSIDLPHLALNQPEGVFKVHFQGKTDTAHHTQIALNGTVISDEIWDGYAQHTQEITVPMQQLDNTLTITLPGDLEEKTDKVYLNWININYWRTLSAENDTLTLTVAETGNKQLTIDQFTQADIVVYEVTDPYAVTEITPAAIEEKGEVYQVTFEDNITEVRTYHVTTPKQFKRPVTITLWQPSHLQSPKNGADYILITTETLLPAVTPLTDLRKKQGLRVKTASVEEIYDEFNAGIVDPIAIKRFLQFAYTDWQSPAPTYVLLVGDATIDYRGYLRSSKKSLVPAHLIDIDGFQFVIPPSDNWYVSVQGDDVLPEMLIGRIPADSVETATRIIQKIVHFETATSPSPNKILLVADADKSFKNLHEKIIVPLISNLFTIDKVYLSDYFAQAGTLEERAEQVSIARQAIIDHLNAGTAITTYYGHGTASNWSASTGLFRTGDVDDLTNKQTLTFLLTMSCINGHFTTPYKASLAETFITSPAGMVAGLLPSNLSYPSEDVVLADELFRILFAQPDKALGAITTQAKVAAFECGASAELVDIFTFFGDPATTLKSW